MPRYRLIVKGRVQTVGYRALVMQIARNMQIKGLVRNLADGSVEVFAECNVGDIDIFQKTIDIKSEEHDLFSPSVENIEVHEIGDEEHSGEPDTFDKFEIDYGSELNQFEKESLERSEMGVLILSGTKSEIGGVRSDIQSMHTDMNDRFNELDTKYGAINENMKVLTSELHRSTEALVALLEKLGDKIE